MVRPLSRFWRDTKGASLVEGLIAFPVIFFTITTLIEGGMALYQYNQVAKATAVGARLAAVSDPVIAGLTDNRLAADPATDEDGVAYSPGDPYPILADPVECGADVGTACDPDRLRRLVEGAFDTANPTERGCAAEPGTLGMCDIAPRIRAENVRVSYIFSGLGYIGRPFNPVVSVRVEVRNVTFDFFLLAALFGFENLEIPTQSVTITSEDLSTTPLGVTSGSGA